ncbi:MAG: type II toxin-antitoxin system HigB family toxin [Pirellulaceae bacterium]|nr:type II toxin-antitoxin system HigB family toxin [Pirellulaceae bacterium]
MRVISKARLKQFWQMPGYQDAEGPLRAWYTHVNSRTVSWQFWGDVKGDFGNASLVGSCAVFNIGGNKYRLVTRVLYPSQKVFILRVMSHADYDAGKWKDECGGFAPPPGKRTPETRRRKQGAR